MPVEVQKLLRQARLEQQEKGSRVDRVIRRKGEEPFVAGNWRDIPAKELAAMPRVAQSRYQAVSISYTIVHSYITQHRYNLVSYAECGGYSECTLQVTVCPFVLGVL